MINLLQVNLVPGSTQFCLPHRDEVELIMKKNSQNFTDLLPTRMSLLKRASLEEQADAWNELLIYYDPFVSKILLRWGIGGSDLDDVKQQVFMRLWKGLSNYKKLDNGSKFRNWLSTLIRRTAINWYHSQS
jgi:DNA-directed RNA polymerase specialized sigma subunit